jgi:hypothetical protein
MSSIELDRLPVGLGTEHLKGMALGHFETIPRQLPS